jgi:hypothetical protein
MTEYTEVVATMRQRHHAEQWGAQVSYVLAQDGYVETALNSGQVKRIYHRDYDEHKAGDEIILEEGMTLDRLVIECPSSAD